jgi:MIP family channel proteins
MGRVLLPFSNVLVVPMAFGAAVLLAALLLGRFSGAHINPAVSVALTVAGRFPSSRLPGYLCAQFLGALVAAFILRLLLGNAAAVGSTLPAVGHAQAAAIETLLTLALVAVVLLAGLLPWAPRSLGALAVGTTVALEAYLAGPLTGASMNPARSLGPALAAGRTAELWIYLIGPAAGGVCAALALRATQLLAVRLKRRPEPGRIGLTMTGPDAGRFPQAL